LSVIIAGSRSTIVIVAIAVGVTVFDVGKWLAIW